MADLAPFDFPTTDLDNPVKFRNAMAPTLKQTVIGYHYCPIPQTGLRVW